MGRKGSRFIPFVKEGLISQKYENLTFENGRRDVFCINLPHKTKSLKKSEQRILQDWYRVTGKTYHFEKDYIKAKQSFESTMRKSDYLDKISTTHGKLIYRFSSAEEISAKKLSKMGRKEKISTKTTYPLSPASDTSGYETGPDSPQSVFNENKDIYVFQDHNYAAIIPDSTAFIDEQAIIDQEFWIKTIDSNESIHGKDLNFNENFNSCTLKDTNFASNTEVSTTYAYQQVGEETSTFTADWVETSFDHPAFSRKFVTDITNLATINTNCGIQQVEEEMETFVADNMSLDSINRDCSFRQVEEETETFVTDSMSLTSINLDCGIQQVNEESETFVTDNMSSAFINTDCVIQQFDEETELFVVNKMSLTSNNAAPSKFALQQCDEGTRTCVTDCMNWASGSSVEVGLSSSWYGGRSAEKLSVKTANSSYDEEEALASFMNIDVPTADLDLGDNALLEESSLNDIDVEEFLKLLDNAEISKYLDEESSNAMKTEKVYVYEKHVFLHGSIVSVIFKEQEYEVDSNCQEIRSPGDMKILLNPEILDLLQRCSVKNVMKHNKLLFMLCDVRN